MGIRKTPVYNLLLRPVIILFAKAPVPGRVKTRLFPRLSPAEAASLHDALVRDTISSFEALSDCADLELHSDAPVADWGPKGWIMRLQHEGDLGLKMLQALSGALARGHERAMIAGSDAPTLPVAHLRALLACEADVALGRAEDGGYYAIACRRAHPEMFRDVAWSGTNALDETVAACGRCGLSVEIGPRWWDVDTPEDLERLAQSPDMPAHTAAWFRKML